MSRGAWKVRKITKGTDSNISIYHFFMRSLDFTCLIQTICEVCKESYFLSAERNITLKYNSSSHPEVFYKKCVVKSFIKLTGKPLRRSLFLLFLKLLFHIIPVSCYFWLSLCFNLTIH